MNYTHNVKTIEFFMEYIRTNIVTDTEIFPQRILFIVTK